MKNRLWMLLACLAPFGIAAPSLADEPLKQLSEHLDRSFRLRFDAYPWKPGSSVVPDPVIEGSTLNAVLFLDWKTWVELSGRTRLDTAGWFEYGAPYTHRWRGGIDFLQDDQNLSRPLVFNELYTTTHWGPVDLVAGRTIRRNTLSILYPLADRYVTRDYNDPVDSKLLGTWQVRLDYYAEGWECSFGVLPVFQPPKVPGIESRWWFREVEPITGVPFPADGNGEVNVHTPGVSIDDTALIATLKARHSRWDFFTTAYHGNAPHAVTRLSQPTPTDYFVDFEYVPGFDWSAGLSTSFDALELHAETLYHRAYSRRDDEYAAALAGFLWQFDRLAEWLACDQIHFAAEYAREHVIEAQDDTLGYASSSAPFRFGRDTLFTEWRFDITDRNSAAFGLVHDFEHGNVFSRIRGGRRFGNGKRIDVVLDLFAGDGLYFGTWEHNDRLSLIYESNF